MQEHAYNKHAILYMYKTSIVIECRGSIRREAYTQAPVDGEE